MVFLHIYTESLKLPNKKALFKLNRLGMDVVVVYLFIMLFIVSLPALIDQIVDPSGFSSYLNIFFLFIYFFIFYYLPLNLIVFGFLSLIAFFGKWITKLMNRKLRYSILWKMCAYTTTLPFTLYTIIALFFPISNMFLWLSIFYTVLLLIKMISIYPTRRKRS